MSSWFQKVKKYVWNEDKTPFHLTPKQMRKQQAHNELFFYAAFEGVLSAMLIFGILAQMYITGDTAYVPLLLYGLIITGVQYFLIKRKNTWAALLSSSPPLVISGILFTHGFHPNNTIVEKLLLGCFLACWLIYSFRIQAICRNFPGMSDNKIPAPSV